MARLHSKKKGRSGSKRPTSKVSPAWVEYSAHEVEELIVKFAKEGNNPTQIGLILRDKYGVPSIENLCGKSASKILEASNLLPTYPDDLISLIRRAVKMRNHLKDNKSDKHNRVKLSHVEAKINRLVKYYRDNGRLAPYWKYDPSAAALLVK
ncbi:30S ribosomal protein S15 [Candidatus Anstonella stagnisolia]|nr:30S ribosomal protein S15 [Candidatus Anstonella stagnisolia]